jgi:glucose/arabinose dehydrogenase/type 1 glutamine amidotransferase
MARRIRKLGMLLTTALALAWSGLVAMPAPATATADPSAAPIRILVFHTSTEPAAAGVAAIRDLGRHHGFAVDTTQDAAAFADPNLGRYRAVVFLSGAGDALSPEQETGLQQYVRAGGGFLGIADAALTQPGSAWFTGLVGGRPGTSPTAVQRAVVEVGDRVHPASRNLPLEWPRADQWFNWSPNPVGTVHTVANLRERSYTAGDGANGPYHPISWCRDYDGGRSFYTGMGHTAASFDRDLSDHLLGAIRWTAGMVRADCKATIAANYTATRLTQPNQTGQLDQIGEPHGLTIARDGRVFYIGRGGPMTGGPAPVTDWNDPNIGLGHGTIHVWNPATGAVSLVADLAVFGNKGGGPELNKTEEGLVGMTLSPDFERTGWIYVFWMPHASIDRVRHVGFRTISRFTVDNATNTLVAGSEKVLLRWEAQIDRCCHVGGGMVFDAVGNLFVSVGDNNSSQCDGCTPAPSGYSGNNPVPEFAGISQQDARRTAGNTNNLNGKILRIHPERDGTYAIPKGNLFTGKEEGGGKTRPEIYAMGVRNPTRLAVDSKTGWLLAGWVGPDASQPNVNWGPAKYETATVITKPGNYGWPYCMGDKQPYRDRNLPDIKVPLGWYDCDHPRNDSPRNTGLVNLPPVQPNNIWYSPQGGGPVFERGADGIPIYDAAHQTLTMPYLPSGGGQAIMPGPMYRFDPRNPSAVKWPEYWDGKWFIGDESRAATRVTVLMDSKTAGSGGAPVTAVDLRPFIPIASVGHLMDWKFGPDGALYVLDYGTGFFNATAASALWRITYTGGPPTPAPCPAPDARPTVRFLDTDSGVPNRVVADGCTINDLIDDERAWESQGRFVAHVAGVALRLRADGVISTREVQALLEAAVRSRIGSRNGPRPYEVIFDGSAESLAPWVQAPSGSFTLRPDGSIRSVGGLGMLWYAGKQFGDFSLRLQFRDARTDTGFSNSGVFTRFPDPRIPLEQRPPGSCGTVGNARTSPAWVAIYCGQEVQIYDGPTGEPQKTGSIYNFAPLGLDAARPTPRGQWNDYEVRVVGQHYTIVRNGVVINEFDNTPGKTSSRAGDPPTDLRQFLTGFVGLQNHSTSDLIEFRNIRVRGL